MVRPSSSSSPSSPPPPPQQFPSSVLAIPSGNLVDDDDDDDDNESRHDRQQAQQQERRRLRIRRIKKSGSTIRHGNNGFFFASRNATNSISRRATSSNRSRKEHSSSLSLSSLIIIAIALWYSLGIVSISTTKLLLLENMPPLLLTFQQLCIGSTLLQWWKTTKQQDKNDNGNGNGKDGSNHVNHSDLDENRNKNNSNKNNNDDDQDGNDDLEGLQLTRRQSSLPHWTNLSCWIRPPTALVDVYQYLVLERPQSQPMTTATTTNTLKSSVYLLATAACFTFGFTATNFAFGTSSASFVETIKAAEPLTSAGLAVIYGLETLGTSEWNSLLGIVVGVLCSTLGNAATTTTSTTTTSTTTTTPWMQSFYSCGIVMTANLCFSFRGLYQKWWSATSSTFSKNNISSGVGNHPPSSRDAIALQFQMQQLGVWILMVPTILFHGLWIGQHVIVMMMRRDISTVIIARYIGLALINGMAFTSYNLASTFLLSRITVTHHAALNCLRRLFAIVVTSILFAVPMTTLGIIGIAISMLGFLSFQHFKQQKKTSKATNNTTTMNDSSTPKVQPHEA